MKSPTEKQMKLIKNIERMTDEKFTGTTIAEASQFISKNMEAYKEAMELAFDMMYYDDAY